MTPGPVSSDGTIKKQIAGLLGDLSAFLSERTLRTVVLGPGQGWIVNRSVLAKDIRPPLVVLHSLSDEFWLECRDAVTLAGFWLRAGDEVIGSARAERPALTDAYRGALREIADAMHRLLRKRSGVAAGGPDTTAAAAGAGAGAEARVELMRRDNDVTQRAAGRAGDDLFLFSFACTLDAFPSSRMHLLLTPDTARDLNGGIPLVPSDGAGADDLQPPAAVRAALAIYARDRITLRSLRRVCRRIGFRHEPHVHAEVPNPSVHRDGFVLIQIGEGDENRFDWCKRLKTLGGSVKVCLLLDYPSRSNVLRACRSGADSVIGVPATEMEFSELLGEWLPEESVGNAKGVNPAGVDDPAAIGAGVTAAGPVAGTVAGAGEGARNHEESKGPSTDPREPAARP